MSKARQGLVPAINAESFEHSSVRALYLVRVTKRVVVAVICSLGDCPSRMYYYRKRGSASYIVREVLLVRERERERDTERER